MDLQTQHNVPNHGFVKLIGRYGSDQGIVDAARVSYNAGKGPAKTDVCQFLRNLVNAGHMTPFEHAGITILVKCPIFVWRQWIRHRLASVNELSGRYSEMDCEFYSPSLWRSKKPLSQEDVLELDRDTRFIHAAAERVYKRRLELGISRELARVDLPLSLYTVAYWTANLREVFHFLKLRISGAAQNEMREYAYGVGLITRWLFPYAFDAFVKKNDLIEEFPEPAPTREVNVISYESLTQEEKELIDNYLDE